MLTPTSPLLALLLTGSISQAPDQLDLRVFDSLVARSNHPGDHLDLRVLELARPAGNRSSVDGQSEEIPAIPSPEQPRPAETLDLRVLGVNAVSATTDLSASRTAAPVPAATFPGMVEAPGAAAASVTPAVPAATTAVTLPPWHRPGITYWHSTGEWKTVPQAGVVYQPPALWWQTSGGRVCINGQCR